MDYEKEWADSYLTPEQQGALDEVSEQEYVAVGPHVNAMAGLSLAEKEYAASHFRHLASELSRFVAEGMAPEAEPGQRLAALHAEFLETLNLWGDDSADAAGQLWQALPDAEEAGAASLKPFPWGEEEARFLQLAMDEYIRQNPHPPAPAST